jgi:hypothetical protein
VRACYQTAQHDSTCFHGVNLDDSGFRVLRELRRGRTNRRRQTLVVRLRLKRYKLIELEQDESPKKEEARCAGACGRKEGLRTGKHKHLTRQECNWERQGGVCLPLSSYSYARPSVRIWIKRKKASMTNRPASDFRSRIFLHIQLSATFSIKSQSSVSQRNPATDDENPLQASCAWKNVFELLSAYNKMPEAKDILRWRRWKRW